MQRRVPILTLQCIVILSLISFVIYQNFLKSISTESNTLSTNKRQPITKYIYVKIPKTGSSTVKKIFERYAQAHKLKPFLPNSPISWHISPQSIDPPPKSTYEIIYDHVVIDFKWMDVFVPNATYVTFLRDPVDRTLSQYFYREETQVSVKNDINLGNGRRCVWGYFPPEERLDVTAIAPWIDFCKPGWNNQFLYLGGKMTNLARFTFIGITERMEESLLVMRRLFNWKFSDIIHLDYKVNLGRPQLDEISINVRNIVAKANEIDIQLYKLYNSILQSYIDLLGDIYKKDLEFLKLLQEQCKVLEDEEFSVYVECIEEAEVSNRLFWKNKY